MVFVAWDVVANDPVVGGALQHDANPVVRYRIIVTDSIIAGRFYGNALVIVVRYAIVQELIVVAGRL